MDRPTDRQTVPEKCWLPKPLTLHPGRECGWLSRRAAICLPVRSPSLSIILSLLSVCGCPTRRSAALCWAGHRLQRRQKHSIPELPGGQAADALRWRQRHLAQAAPQTALPQHPGGRRIKNLRTTKNGTLSAEQSLPPGLAAGVAFCVVDHAIEVNPGMQNRTCLSPFGTWARWSLVWV
jgi:hypothetical protein